MLTTSSARYDQLVAAAHAYEGLGVSLAGATQFLNGQIVKELRDRARLSTIMAELCRLMPRTASPGMQQQILARNLVASGVADGDAQLFATGFPVLERTARARIAEIGLAVAIQDDNRATAEWLNLSYANKTVPRTG